MKDKKENLVDVEIIEEDDKKNDLTNDWMGDFVVQSKEDDIFIIEEPLVESENKTEALIDDIEIIEPKLTTNEVTQILNAAEIKEKSENYQLNVFGEEESKEVLNMEKELDNNRSVAFIVGLFSILILFVLLLPFITKLLK